LLPAHLTPVTAPSDAIPVGRVQGAYNLRGQVKAFTYSDDPESLLRLSGKHGGETWLRLHNQVAEIRVTKTNLQSGLVVMSFAGIDDRTQAEKLKNAEILVRFASLPSLEKEPLDTYYWLDLIGCQVINREAHHFGVVSGLLETGAHDILQIEAQAPATDQAVEKTPQTLIPFLARFVDTVDVANKQIRVDWPTDFL
jgi:16S rRNA processing protein RimM